MSTDKEWEKWGSTEPYFGVITEEKFKSSSMNDENMFLFFQSGEHDIENIISRCRALSKQSIELNTALDFGCGVGRLVIPLAKKFNHVVGVDVSPSMLREAKINIDRAGITNADLRLSDDTLSHVPEQFDLVNTTIVLQHILPERGILIFKELVKRVKPRGFGSIQITYSKATYSANLGVPNSSNSNLESFNGDQRKDRGFLSEKLRTIRIFTRKFRKASKKIINVNFEKFERPKMEMHEYNLNQIFFILQQESVDLIKVDFTNHGGHLGMYLTFQKSA